MIDLRVLQQRISYGIPNRALIPILIPMFLIISSSVYPAIMSSLENKDMQIISKVMAEQQKDDVISSRYQAHIQMIGSSSGSSTITPSSPTPIDPTISSTTEENSSDSPPTIQQQQNDGMDIMSISSGKAVHTIWVDGTPGNDDILYKRDGADYDPTTLNLSNNAGSSTDAKIAVSGNNVHVVWEDGTSGNSEVPLQKVYRWWSYIWAYY